jgi:hypothetical protein
MKGRQCVCWCWQWWHSSTKGIYWVIAETGNESGTQEIKEHGTPSRLQTGNTTKGTFLDVFNATKRISTPLAKHKV